MPSETVMFAVSTGIGVSVIAGIISGVCYVFIHGIKHRELKKPILKWHCTVCGNYLRSIEGILEGEKVVTCSKCNGRVCKNRCAKPDRTKEDAWTCKVCLAQKSWFRGILNDITLSGNQLRKKMNPEPTEEHVEAVLEKEKEQVRRYIERLVSDLLGESVDEARISKIYKDKEYLPVTGQSPYTAHATLKQIVERLLTDASHLPALNKTEEDLAVSSDERNRTYEDLLATAILNKVVSSYQKSPSPAPSTSSRLSTSSRTKGESEYFFGDKTLDTKWKSADLDTTSVSSLEEWLQPSDSSMGSTKYIDRLSLTIQHRIEEGSASDSEEDHLDDSEYFRTNSNLLINDDSNWYLQRRQFQGTHSPVPVPMLVPNPTIEAKVLIGDKEVEDTSDLSDAPSDYGDQESVPSVKTLLVTSKMVIGGRNALSGDRVQNVSDTESSGDSGVKEDKDEDDAFYKVEANIHLMSNDEVVQDASLNSIYSNTEQDTEYTERYASLPRTILKTPPSTIRVDKKNYENKSKAESTFQENETAPLQNVPENEENLDESMLTSDKFEGLYSKKEKEKWKHPVEMKNNPYSKDSIEKRLKSSAGFGRDYYTRQASNPSGAKTSAEKLDRKPWFTKSITSDEDDRTDVYRAVPTLLIDGDDETIVAQEIPKTVDKSVDDSNVSEITSDSDLSLVNYYDVENSKIYQQNTNGNHTEIRISSNTEGLLYNPIDPEMTPPKEKPPEIPISLSETEEEQEMPEMELKTTVNTGLVYDSPESNEPVDVVDASQSESAEKETAPSAEIRVTVNNPVIHEIDDVLQKDIEDVFSIKDEEPVVHANFTVNNTNQHQGETNIEDSQFLLKNEEKPVEVKIIPQVKPRTFVPPIAQRRNKFNENNIIVRNNSSSDSFDNPPTIINRKSDNTLIKKIYSDPIVRSFALTNREHIPSIIDDNSNITNKKPPEIVAVQAKTYEKTQSPIVKTDENCNIEKIDAIHKAMPEISVSSDIEWQSDGFSLEFSDSSDHSRIQSPVFKEDFEISELKAKRLVASRLGEFSKSFPNLNRTSSNDDKEFESPKEKTLDRFEFLNTSPFERSFSVKDLKKRFESNEVPPRKDKPVHSLTARSISKPMRDKLKSQDSNESGIII